jgi:hypothetical protein
MKLLLDIKDDKASFIIELLKNFKFVKAKRISPQKAEIFEDLKEAVDEVNSIKAGKKKGKALTEFLDEL